MSIDVSLMITLYTDPDGQDRFKVVHPTEDDMVDVTDQFDMSVITMPDGQLGFAVFKKQFQPTPSGCLDGPTEF